MADTYLHNTEIEQSVLAALLVNTPARLSALARLKESRLYEDRHKIILRAINRICDQTGEPGDIARLADELKKSGELNTVGGGVYLSELIDHIPAAVNLDHYIKTLENLALKRELFDFANVAYKAAVDNHTAAIDDIGKLTQRLIELSSSGTVDRNILLADSVLAVIEKAEQMTESGQQILGIKTGFYELDEVLNGLVGGRLIILAARPSKGKTALAVNIAVNAVKNGHPCQIFSLEMEHADLTRRILSSESKVKASAFDRGIKDKSKWESIIDAAERLSKYPLFIDDTPGLSNLDLLRLARKYKAERGIQLYIVDYAQLLHGQHPQNRVQDVSDISRTLKQMSKELSAPVLALSQLNREVEKRPDQKPRLSDLRESGDIEQDADQVIFIWNNPQDTHTYLMVAKNRHGQRRRVRVDFVTDFVQFRTLADI
jgi:replicative DNA helicase